MNERPLFVASDDDASSTDSAWDAWLSDAFAVQDARQIIELLDVINLSPVPATEVRAAIGETRFAQLLKAQVLGFLPLEGPLHKREAELVGFGSPAMQHYFLDRLASPSIKKASSEGRSGWTAWTKLF